MNIQERANTAAQIPADYLERVYAGVLGKLIGVYLGRPFEQWTHQRIMAELGPITGYVHERLGQPLVVTDDDVAGTFTFVRALEEHRCSPDLTAEEIGRTWLNQIVENRTILWWGGNGNSTEHTAWLNLKKGIPAPDSGSIETNGTTVAEQIGAQIFIDGWALVSPGNPAQAARLAREAGRVSHDGESVHAAVLWAAMEAEAFLSSDVDHLIDTGLLYIPSDSLIARLIADVRGWVRQTDDWMATRDRIEDRYGYDKFPGNCHVVPNHALMIMALLHAPHDFGRAQMIVNTSGWDTDCNAGNLGCLQGIMLGLAGIDQRPDLRGPLADRMLISSADGGFSINDAAQVALRLTSLGRRLAGHAPLTAPKDGARFHFTLPGSVQGFRPQPGLAPVSVTNEAGTLALTWAAGEAAATTPTFTPPEVLAMRTYDLLASPLLSPGQTLRARVQADAENVGPVTVRLRLRPYDEDDRLSDVDGPSETFVPGETRDLAWRVPDQGGQPIAEVGVALSGSGGRVRLDRLDWDGAPDVVLRRPAGGHENHRLEQGPDFWRLAWVNGADILSKRFPPDFRISQARGEGLILHGTRAWTDYVVAADVTLHLGAYGGIAVRAQGLRRMYAVRIRRDGWLQILRIRDAEETLLAEAPLVVSLEQAVAMTVTAEGDRITATADGVTLSITDSTFADGAIGLLVYEGALSTKAVRLRPVHGVEGAR